MLIARQNFKTISEVQPTVSFTIAHMDGRVVEHSAYKTKGLKCFEIQYLATGNIALQVLSSTKEMSRRLEVVDMHISYKRGIIIIQLLTCLSSSKVEDFVKQKGKFFFAHYSIKRKKKNTSRWIANKATINQEYIDSSKIQKFVLKLSENQYILKELVLN